MPPIDTPAVPETVSVVTGHPGPHGIAPGDRLWIDPDAYSGVQVYATPRGYVAAEQPPADAWGPLGRVASLHRRVAP
jgi:hypothetical protein